MILVPQISITSEKGKEKAPRGTELFDVIIAGEVLDHIRLRDREGGGEQRLNPADDLWEDCIRKSGGEMEPAYLCG